MKLRGILIAAIAVLVACKTPPLRRLNVVLITVDTLRADRLGCYGYSRIETPNLDQLAREGALLESAVAQAPLTAPSHASMFTGMYPTGHKVRDTGGFVLESPHRTLAEILQERGWDTAAFVGASVLKKSFGFGRGFSVYDDRMPKPAAGSAAEFPERRASEVVDRAIAWLGPQSGKPFFLWVHVFDPHFPFDPPPPFKERYAGRPYDGEVAYTDQQLGRLLEAAAKKSPRDSTLTIVMSDHGESLSEHGEYTHGVFLYDSTLRIAFMMAGPGIPAGLRVKQQARSIDLLPTILELLRITPPRDLQGASLTPVFSGRSAPADYSYAETLFPKINMGWVELRALRTKRWKYIRAPKPELYDLVQDPAETTNVYEKYPEQVRDLDAKLKAVAGAGKPERVETSLVDRRTMEQLKSLGYLGGSSRSEYELTGKGIDPKDRTSVLNLLYFATSPDPALLPGRRIEMLRRALAEDPANPTIYYHLGEMLRQAGRHDEAMKLYLDGVRRGLRNGWLYARLGHLYLRQGHQQEAIAAYEKAAQLNPSDCESLSDLGTAYLETGRLADAERVFKWSLAADEEHALSHNGLGLVFIRKQDLAAARGYFEKAVQLDPDLLEAQLNLGRIYKMIGAHTRARACFETFLAKAPPAQYGPLIARIKQELAEMQ